MALLVLEKEGQVPEWARTGARVAFNWPEKEALPTTSRAVVGEAVFMPTLLLVVSTLKTLVSMVRSEVTDSVVSTVREFKVDEPETVRVLEESLSGFRVMGPMPLVLEGGRTNVVGVMRWKEEKSLERLERFILVESRREETESRRSENWVRT